MDVQLTEVEMPSGDLAMVLTRGETEFGPRWVEVTRAGGAGPVQAWYCGTHEIIATRSGFCLRALATDRPRWRDFPGLSDAMLCVAMESDR